jgi:uncharacterized protein with HEPN domain
MSFGPHDYLRHILAEADYLIAQSRGLSPERFHPDETLRRAFVRSLEVIGEASKKVSPEFRAAHPAPSPSRALQLTWGQASPQAARCSAAPRN